MAEDFNHYKKEGDKYFSASRKKGKTLDDLNDTEKVAKTLTPALEFYRTAKCFAKKPQDRIYADEKIYSIRKELRNLEQITGNTFYVVLSFASLVLALIFIVSNLTGNVVGASGFNDTRWMSVCFFLCGLVFAFFYLRGK